MNIVMTTPALNIRAHRGLSCWRNAISPSRCRLAIAVLVLGISAATGAAAQAPSGKILFGRTILNPDGTARSSSLFRVEADGSGVRQLTPKRAGLYHASPSWSPGGGQIAYGRRDALGEPDIHVMDSQGRRSRQITSGLHHFNAPAWGPDGTIAFVYDSPDPIYGELRSCVGTIRADGSQQQIRLRCPLSDGSDQIRMNRVAWSADGQSLYFGAGYDGLTCDCTYLYTYRVDARTGAATLLATARAFYFFSTHEGGEPAVAFAPDGSHALYSGGFYDPYDPEGEGFEGITRIDFSSNQETRLIDDEGAYAPLYSKDGSRFAFTWTFESGGQRYDHLFVANADGSNVRQLTTAQVDNIQYIAADWSDDGRHLLVNRSIWQEDRRSRRRALRIIDVDTRAVTALPAQYAYPGAWLTPRQEAVP